MRLIAIPPYQNPSVGWVWVLRELVEDYRKAGGLEGIEVDIDEGYPVESTSEKRDEELLAFMNVGIIKKVREYSQMGRYDAIVLTGAIDPGLAAARLVSMIPVSGAMHSALHVASLIGERVSEIHTVPSTSIIVRHLAERYGFNQKLVSVRIPMHTSTEAFEFLQKYKDRWPDRLNDPGLKKIMDDFTAECIAAVEENRADAIILAGEHHQACADGVRERLDKAGYQEIPIIRALPAGLEMAKAMVNMKLSQTARAYPGHDLKAAPKYW